MAAMLQDYRAKPDLPERMRALADHGKHPRALELFARAQELEEAILFNGDKAIPTLVGAWARARRLFCDITGEELI